MISDLGQSVWLIRHGESAANAGAATLTADSIPLTSRGVEQAKTIADTLPLSPELIVTSPYLRARQTAEPTIRRYPVARVEEWRVEEFTYLSSCSGKPTTANDRRPLVKEYWDRRDVHYCDGAGAESFAQFMQRARFAVDELASSSYKQIAFFSHGQLIRAMIFSLLRSSPRVDSGLMKEFEYFLLSFPLQNGAIIELASAQDGFAVMPLQVGHLSTETVPVDLSSHLTA